MGLTNFLCVSVDESGHVGELFNSSTEFKSCSISSTNGSDTEDSDDDILGMNRRF